MLQIIFRSRYSHMYNTLVEMGFVNVFTVMLCTMGRNATDYALICNPESAFPYEIDVGDLGLIFFGICVVLILLHVISMIKTVKCRKIASCVPLLLNTLDLVFYPIYLANAIPAIFALFLKLVGEFVLLKSHII